MKAKEVLRLTGITRETLSRLVKKGVIRGKKRPNGFYEYNADDVYTYTGKSRKKLMVIYARVSTRKQKRDLANQVKKLENYCASKGHKIDKVFQDIASGIDFEKRSDFFRLLDLVIDNQVSVVFITYKDRLSRVGFGLFEHLFAKYGTKIEVINEAGNAKLDSEEIFEEIISLLHAFSMKHYASRRKLKKIKEVLGEEESENEA
ncbi:MAG: IS607 family transposase [Anaerolineaceae bacterium 4572_78]|nr:MAG: IS607 family transposase [Anaerolineaceae bacterium 4572_78]